MRVAAEGNRVAIDSWHNVHMTRRAREAPERGMLLVDAVLRRGSFALNPRPCYPGCVSRLLLFPLLRGHGQWEAAIRISMLATRHPVCPSSRGAGQPTRREQLIWGPRPRSRRRRTCSSPVGPWCIHPPPRQLAAVRARLTCPTLSNGALQFHCRVARLPRILCRRTKTVGPHTFQHSQPYPLLSHLLRLHAREAVSLDI
jgi:hypothetical protein